MVAPQSQFYQPHSATSSRSQTVVKSKVFAVSVKDRGAISLAGHSGKAFWFSKAQSEFVTSNYYYDEYPAWVDRWNEKAIPSQYSKQKWELSLPRDAYTLEEHNPDHKVELAGFPAYFPTSLWSRKLQVLQHHANSQSCW